MGWKIFGILVFGGLVFASIQANSGWEALNTNNKNAEASSMKGARAYLDAMMHIPMATTPSGIEQAAREDKARFQNKFVIVDGVFRGAIEEKGHLSIMIEEVDAAGQPVVAEVDADGEPIAEKDRTPIVVEAHMTVLSRIAKSMQVTLAGKRNAEEDKWDVEPLFEDGQKIRVQGYFKGAKKRRGWQLEASRLIAIE